jgi:hypothetical protein
MLFGVSRAVAMGLRARDLRFVGFDDVICTFANRAWRTLGNISL